MSRRTPRIRRWRMGLGGLVVVGLCVMQLGLSMPARAQPEACTLALLQGGYIWQDFGIIIQGETAIPLATAGRVQVDAAGNVTGVFAGSAAGNIATNVTLTGTVTVQPNCTGTFTGTDGNGDPANLALFIDPLTGNMTAVQTDAGFVVSFFLRKDGT